MVSKRDYNAEMVAAARSVLLELTHLLGAYREQIVLVGGWVPEMLLPGAHVGSLDVDLGMPGSALVRGLGVLHPGPGTTPGPASRTISRFTNNAAGPE